MVTSRVWFTAEQKAELWERWKQGQSISSISRALERRTKGGVQRIVSVHGGIAPSARRRAAWTLDLGEREEISRGIAAGLAIRAIARSLGRSLAWEKLPVSSPPHFCHGVLLWKMTAIGGEAEVSV